MGRAISDFFSHAAQWTAYQCGRAHTFAIACGIILIWAITGPMFHYSDTWQLIINTGTTIVTFLMVFLMQNTQTRDTAAIQLKLDELIRANVNARNAMLSLEDLTEAQLKRVKESFAHLVEQPEEVAEKLVEAHDDLAVAQEKVNEATTKIAAVGIARG
ncbi:MAG TPA: low affinity iron permease family protein [Acetobacteraceae bacterium]